MRFLMLLFIFLFTTALAEPLPRGQMDEWTATYVTPWRTVHVNVTPTVPETDVYPILTVQPAYWLPLAPPQVSWRAEIIHADLGGDAFCIEQGSVTASPPRGIQQRSNFHYAPLDLQAAYAPCHCLRLSDALSYAESLLTTSNAQHFGLDKDHLDHVQVTSYHGKDGSSAQPSSLTLHLYTTLRGIPLWGHVGDSLLYPRDTAPSYGPSVTFIMAAEDNFRLMGRTVRETGVVAEDIPLCSFEAVRSVLEAQIMAGHIHHIYHLDLGFALYNEHGLVLSSGKGRNKGVTFYAVPTWRCKCLYTESPSKRLPDGTLENPEPSMYLTTLYIDARTARLVDPVDKSPDAADYTNFKLKD